MIESLSYENKNKIQNFDELLTKVESDTHDLSSEIHKVTYFQERLETISELFKGAQFRMSCIENDFNGLHTDFQELLRNSISHQENNDDT